MLKTIFIILLKHCPSKTCQLQNFYENSFLFCNIATFFRFSFCLLFLHNFYIIVSKQMICKISCKTIFIKTSFFADCRSSHDPLVPVRQQRQVPGGVGGPLHGLLLLRLLFPTRLRCPGPARSRRFRHSVVNVPLVDD
jgi:hypothetical protein